MKYCSTLLPFICLIVFSCSGQHSDSVNLKIKRFDNTLYGYLQKTNTQSELISQYDSFLDLFGKQILQTGGTDSIGFYDRLNTFFAEPALRALYKDEQEKFANIDYIESELSTGLSFLLTEFSTLKQPEVYMHCSGLNQNIVVTDDVLSISADKYMGQDYPLYQHFFYDYQRQLMTPDRIVPDYLLGFLMANFPFQGNEDVLLDRMIYEGKLRYILSRTIPGRQIWEYVGYSKEQYLWCSNNQERIWKSILQNQHLYKSDYLITSQYLKEAPHTAFLPVESPGRVGIWLGYQIVMSYMKNHSDTSLSQLMALTDTQAFLKDAKYKP